MVEWNATEYAHESSLQQWLAEETLASLTLEGNERVLDVGCGDGKITAAIAARLPHGSVLGIDPSTAMIAFASSHFPPATHANLSFAVGDARSLPYRDAFDLVVSFNALHWVIDQASALRALRATLHPGGKAMLQFVPAGERTSLEDVIEETCATPRWAASFGAHQRPYLHPAVEDVRRLAEASGFRVEQASTTQRVWDFKTREAFARFASATFVEWTRFLAADDRVAFIDDVLDRYRAVGSGQPDETNAFIFYQLRLVLRRPS